MALDTSILQEIGLTNAQIRVYLALIELGQTTSGPIIKKSELQNSVVYNALNQLMEIGLVSFVIKGKRKHFHAIDPKALLKLIDDRKEKLEALVPELEAKHELSRTKQEAQVFVGWKGLQTALNIAIDSVPMRGEYIGFPAGYEEQYTEETKKFFREIQKKRALKRLDVKFIANESARDQVSTYRYYEKFSIPKYKFVPGFAPVGVLIFGDSIMNIAFEEQPLAVIITSKQMAESYRRFFYALWEVAKK
ncbi:TrmB family transcriptional regulator [Nanoarchaeota archaeon]